MLDPSDPDAYTVGWVCALSTEFTAAQEQFDEEYEPHESPEHRDANDFNVYSFGKIKGHMVVVAVLPNGQYGTASAATVAKDMIRSFRNIRFGLMVGIGGGAPTKQHDIRLGDVVVSSPSPGQSGVFQYDFGKATKDVFQHTASHNKPPPLLLAAVAGLKTQYERKGLQIHDKVSTIVANNKRLSAKYGRPEDPDSLFSPSIDHKSDPCPKFCVTAPTDLVDRKPRQEPMEVVEVHYGTIASGNTLMKDAFKRDELASKANILCFEMEAAGLMDGFQCLVIRGICDYSDSHKNDRWQGYAAMTAAVYAKQILGRIRPEAVAREETIISKIDEVISGVENLKRSISEQEVLNWLSDEDFGTYQFDERSKKAPGTCQWFLDSPEYQSWTQEKGQVLFCPGIAGAGKTVLASAIIESLHSRFQSDSSTAIVHIYCRYNRVDRQTFNKLRASLLRQLCERLSPLPEGIMQLYNQYKPRRVEAPPERILSELESVSGLFSKVFMVVDALDEWRATEHADLYSLPGELLHLQRKLAMNLLATSRPIPLIANQFNNYPSISITAQQQDIYAYVDNFRWPESSCIGKITGLRGLVKKVMSQIVRGMFLLARLYLHSLENETSERDVKDALKRFEDRAKNDDNDPKRFGSSGKNYTALADKIQDPLYTYSAFNWGGHVRRLSPLDQTYKTSIDFLQTRGMVDQAIMLILTLGTWSEDRQAPQDMSNLHLAALFGLGDLAESLMKNIDINSRDSCGRTALVWALECLAFEFKFSPDYIMSVTKNFEIYDGIDIARRRVVNALLRSGANPRMPGYNGDTPLHLAAILGDVEIVERILEYGVDIDILNRNVGVPLEEAVRHSRESASMKLLESGTVDTGGENSRTAHTETSSVSNLAPMETLIEKGAKADFPDINGQTALMEASKRGHNRIDELLLENQSNVDQQDHKGDTALMKACIGDHADVIELLVAANARLDIENDKGDTALDHGGPSTWPQ
uniref:Nephrocystin 3-like N-terminal domain-containing protein n=1 Tax=Fusarium oxysporum (strain Fo5176) TaxID=660025 RepID=A0A0D2YGC9_FUSOF